MAEIGVQPKRSGGGRWLLLVLLLLALAALAYWYFFLNRPPSPESPIAPATTRAPAERAPSIAAVTPTRPTAVSLG